MLPINDRERLANLEASLRRTDREFVRYMKRIADALLPPDRRGEPRPLDDVIACGSRVCLDEEGTPPLPVAQRQVPAFRRVVGVLAWLRRTWLQILTVLWAVGLLLLGVGARTTGGTVVCVTFAAIGFGLAGRRWIVRVGRRIAACSRRLFGTVIGRGCKRVPRGIEYRRLRCLLFAVAGIALCEFIRRTG